MYMVIHPQAHIKKKLSKKINICAPQIWTKEFESKSKYTSNIYTTARFKYKKTHVHIGVIHFYWMLKHIFLI